MSKRDIGQAGTDGPGVPVASSAPSTDLGDMPLILPEASETPLPVRRTWEGYAHDFRELTEQFADLQKKYDLARTEYFELQSQYANVQRQRERDQDRWTVTERARRTLEADKIEQIAGLRDMQSKIDEKEATIARLSGQTAKLEHFDAIRDQLLGLQDLYENLKRQRQLDLERMAASERARKAFEARAVESTSDGQDNRVVQPFNGGPPTAENARDYAAEQTTLSTNSSALDKMLARWMLTRARGAARRGKWGEAATMYQAVLALDDVAKARKQLGHVLREQGRFAAAAGAYRQAIAADPTDGENHFMLGLSEAKQGNAVAARAAYARALALTPTLAEKYSELRDFASRG